MNKEILKLFKGFIGESSNNASTKGLLYGILIPDTASNRTIKAAIELYGRNGEIWNQTFHKSFATVQDTETRELITQQLIHYFSTYGLETLGMGDSNMVYVPREELSIPGLTLDVPFTIIKAMTFEEVQDKLMHLLTSGIALSEDTLKCLPELYSLIDINRLDEIKNREVRLLLYEKFDRVPKDPEEFLKFLIYKLTGNTLKIQSTDLIEILALSNKEEALKKFTLYCNTVPNGMNKLSSIFLRNKKIFLALKTSHQDKTYHTPTSKEQVEAEKVLNAFINRLRKLAKRHHKPMPLNVLDQLTSEKVLNKVTCTDILKALDNTTIFREVRVLNGVLYRLSKCSDIVYRVRNGKSYYKSLEIKDDNYYTKLDLVRSVITNHLVDRLSTKVKDKVIYIPENVVYAMPTSEKQFIGNIPMGSYVSLPRLHNLVYGVHWYNLSKELDWYSRVDLDLKQMNSLGTFGWDARYRSEDRDILFSGDMTDASGETGATELFYIGARVGKTAFLVTLNNYTCNPKDVNYDFVIADCKSLQGSIPRNYMIDPNDIVITTHMTSKAGRPQNALGRIEIDSENIKFYFNDFSISSNARRHSTSVFNTETEGILNYLTTFNSVQVKLNDLLESAGAQVIHSPSISIPREDLEKIEGEIDLIETKADIDLSLESISKDTLIQLISD